MDSPIDLKHVIARIPYKIEPNPGGGFTARASDPAVQPIQAATREELHQKILAAVSAEFPELKIPNGKNVNVSLQVNTSNGGFSFNSNPNAPADIASAAVPGNPALESLLSFTAKHLAPDLAKQLASQAGTTSFKLTINEKTAVRVNSGPQGLTFGPPSDPTLAPNASTPIPALEVGAANQAGTLDGKPITPEPSSLGRTMTLVLIALLVAGGAYLYFHFR